MKAAAAQAWLNSPVTAAVTRYARELMQCIDQARARWVASPDQEALHDFRVAVRRLRSWLEAYEEEVPLPSKLYGKLRRLARSTNRVRDADVALVWLQARRAQLKPSERYGWRWLL
ncbi:MAG: CHAD domain-containing protein, partial [Pseudomonadota bacterium]